MKIIGLIGYVDKYGFTLNLAKAINSVVQTGVKSPWMRKQNNPFSFIVTKFYISLCTYSVKIWCMFSYLNITIHHDFIITHKYNKPPFVFLYIICILFHFVYIY